MRQRRTGTYQDRPINLSVGASERRTEAQCELASPYPVLRYQSQNVIVKGCCTLDQIEQSFSTFRRKLRLVTVLVTPSAPPPPNGPDGG